MKWLTSTVSNKIAGILALLLLAAFAASGILTYESQKSNIMKEITNGYLDKTHISKSFVEFYLNDTLELLEKIASHLEKSKEHLDEKMALVAIDGAFSATTLHNMFIAYPDGRGITVAQNKKPHMLDFDVRGRPWYKNASAQKKPSYSDSYPSKTLEKNVVMGCAPVGGGTGTAVYVCTELLLADIQKEVAKFTTKEGATAYILSEKNEIISHTKESLILSKDPNTMKIVNELVDLYNKDPNSLFFYSQNGANFVGLCKQESVKGWKVCIDEPMSATEATLRDVVKSQVLTTTFFIIFVVLAVLYVIRHNLKPVETIKTALLSFFDFLNHKSSHV
ncbi:MAG: PDC sensor domain-containing protein, partial [Helicobacteraceae bacterium]